MGETGIRKQMRFVISRMHFGRIFCFFSIRMCSYYTFTTIDKREINKLDRNNVSPQRPVSYLNEPKNFFLRSNAARASHRVHLSVGKFHSISRKTYIFSFDVPSVEFGNSLRKVRFRLHVVSFRFFVFTPFCDKKYKTYEILVYLMKLNFA